MKVVEGQKVDQLLYEMSSPSPSIPSTALCGLLGTRYQHMGGANSLMPGWVAVSVALSCGRLELNKKKTKSRKMS